MRHPHNDDDFSVLGSEIETEDEKAYSPCGSDYSASFVSSGSEPESRHNSPRGRGRHHRRHGKEDRHVHHGHGTTGWGTRHGGDVIPHPSHSRSRSCGGDAEDEGVEEYWAHEDGDQSSSSRHVPPHYSHGSRSSRDRSHHHHRRGRKSSSAFGEDFCPSTTSGKFAFEEKVLRDIERNRRSRKGGDILLLACVGILSVAMAFLADKRKPDGSKRNRSMGRAGR